MAPSDATRLDLAHSLDGVPIPGRRVAPGDWHVTLRFFGEVSDDRIERLTHAIDETPLGPPFDVVWRGVGAFPRASRATVLWVGVAAGAAELVRLAASVEDSAVGCGFAPEDRPFRPHLTLSRIRPPQEVGPVVEAAMKVGARMRCGEVHLMISHLERPAGSRYEVVESFPLG